MESSVDVTAKRKRKRLTRSTTKSFDFYSRSFARPSGSRRRISPPEVAPVTEQSVSSTAVEHSGHGGSSSPGICTLSVPMPSLGSQVSSPPRANSDSDAVTVDQFLCPLPLKPGTARVYGRKNQKRRKATACLDHSDAEDEYVPPSKRAKQRPPGKQHPNKRKVRSLAERLMIASILCDGDPVDLTYEKMDSAVFASRQIAFREESGNRGFLPPQKKRRWNLVDPRTTAPFRAPVFTPLSDSRPPQRSPGDHKPLTKWRTLCNDVPFSQTHSTPTFTRRRLVHTATTQNNCGQLSLVPLEEAEEHIASNAMRRKRDRSFHASKNQPMTPAIDRSLVSSTVLLPVPQPLVFVPQSPRLSSHKRVTFSSVVHSQSMPSAAHRSFDAGSSLPQDINSQGLSASLASSNRLEPLPATSGNLSLPPNESSASATDCNLVPSKAVSNGGKPLKALATFLDGFLETARIAAQIEHSVTPAMVMRAPYCTKNQPERFHTAPTAPQHDTQPKTLPTASVAHETPRHSPNVSSKVTRPLPLRKLSVQSRLVFRSFKSMRPPGLHKSLKPRSSNSQGPLNSNSLAGLSIAAVGSPPLPPSQPAPDPISGQRTCSARRPQNLAGTNTVPSSHSSTDILAALQSFSPFQVVLSSSPPSLVSAPRSANSDDIDCDDYDEEEPSPLSSFASPIPSFAGLVSP